MSKTLIGGRIAGMVLGFMILTTVTTSAYAPVENSKADSIWCFTHEYASLEELREQNTHPLVFVDMNGKKAKLYTPCE